MDFNFTPILKPFNTILTVLGAKKSLIFLCILFGIILFVGSWIKFNEGKVIFPNESVNSSIQLIGLSLLLLGILGFITEMFGQYFPNQSKFQKNVVIIGLIMISLITISFFLKNYFIDELKEVRLEMSDLEDKVQTKKIEIEVLEGQTANLDTRVNQLSIEKESLENSINLLQSENEKHRNKIKELNQILLDKEKNLDFLNNEKDRILEDISSMYEKLEDLELSRLQKVNSPIANLKAQILGVTKRDSSGISINVIISVDGIRNENLMAYIKVFDLDSNNYLTIRGKRSMARFILDKGNAPDYTITLMNTDIKPFCKNKKLRYELYISSLRRPAHRKIF